MHKKKKIRNALMDSAKLLGVENSKLKSIADNLPEKEMRPFQMEPTALLDAADSIRRSL